MLPFRDMGSGGRFLLGWVRQEGVRSRCSHVGRGRLARSTKPIAGLIDNVESSKSQVDIVGTASA